jgi:hypothetical protein
MEQKVAEHVIKKKANSITRRGTQCLQDETNTMFSGRFVAPTTDMTHNPSENQRPLTVTCKGEISLV